MGLNCCHLIELFDDYIRQCNILCNSEYLKPGNNTIRIFINKGQVKQMDRLKQLTTMQQLVSHLYVCISQTENTLSPTMHVAIFPGPLSLQRWGQSSVWSVEAETKRERTYLCYNDMERSLLSSGFFLWRKTKIGSWRPEQERIQEALIVSRRSMIVSSMVESRCETARKGNHMVMVRGGEL